PASSAGPPGGSAAPPRRSGSGRGPSAGNPGGRNGPGERSPGPGRNEAAPGGGSPPGPFFAYQPPRGTLPSDFPFPPLSESRPGPQAGKILHGPWASSTIPGPEVGAFRWGRRDWSRRSDDGGVQPGEAPAPGDPDPARSPAGERGGTTPGASRPTNSEARRP